MTVDSVKKPVSIMLTNKYLFLWMLGRKKARNLRQSFRNANSFKESKTSFLQHQKLLVGECT